MKLLEKLRGKRVGVVLSAGYFGFYGHAGFVDGLISSGINATAWSGTSAGGMIAAFAAAGVSPTEIKRLSSSENAPTSGIPIGSTSRRAPSRRAHARVGGSMERSSARCSMTSCRFGRSKP